MFQHYVLAIFMLNLNLPDCVFDFGDCYLSDSDKDQLGVTALKDYRVVSTRP
jgi:hypothetical protein